MAGALSPKPKVLPGVKPNAGVAANYQKRLSRMVAEMSASVYWFVRASYRANTPLTLAEDELPAQTLRRKVDELRSRWEKNFDVAARDLAKYFTKRANARSEAQLRKILTDAGFNVKFRMSRAQQDVLAATINENVSLIKSIPAKYFTEIEGMVMRSVTTGRDLKQLTDDLDDRYRITRKRCAFIARDQNNKATAALTRAKHLDLGIKKAIWRHSHAGEEPRPSHVKNDGHIYDVSTGWFDPDEKQYIHPGELINCRCFSQPIVEGFE